MITTAITLIGNNRDTTVYTVITLIENKRIGGILKSRAVVHRRKKLNTSSEYRTRTASTGNEKIRCSIRPEWP